jgi:signal transduction histidine kinase/ligand-binding sensor domain-containing protein
VGQCEFAARRGLPIHPAQTGIAMMRAAGTRRNLFPLTVGAALSLWCARAVAVFTSPLWGEPVPDLIGDRNAERLSREAFRVGGLLPSHAPHPKLLAEIRDQFRPPHKGEATWRCSFSRAFVRRIGCCLAVVGAMLWSAPASALDPALDISQYAHTAWKVRDGFTGSPINTIAQTPDGYLWLGTGTGLLRFDGVRNTPWQPPAGTSLPDARIRTLFVSRDGTLWIGTLGGLVSWSGSVLRTYPKLDGGVINALVQDREGTVWVAAVLANKGVLCAIGKTGTDCKGADGSFGGPLVCLYEDSHGTLWAAGSGSLWQLKPGLPKPYALPEGGLALQCLGESAAGRMVVALPTGVWQLAGEKFEPLPGLSLPQNVGAVVALLRDRDDAIWMGTRDGGLLHVHNGRTDSFGRLDGLSGNIAQRLFEDREGSVWVAVLDGGLDRFRALPATTYSTEQGLMGIPTSVLADKGGSVWLSTTEGLYRWGDGRLSAYRARGPVQPSALPQLQGTDAVVIENLPKQGLTSMFEDSHGRIWLGAQSALGYIENQRFVALNGVPAGFIDSIAEDKQGNLLVAHRNAGLLRVSTDLHVQQIRAPVGSPADAGEWRVAVDPVDGSLWLGLFSGGVIHVVDGAVRASFSAAEGLGKGFVNDLRVAADGSVWAATQGGLSRIKAGRVATINGSNGLPCDAVMSSIEDGEGSTWIYTACGLVRVARADLGGWIAAVDQGKPAPAIHSAVLDTSDGVRSNSPPAPASTPHMTLARDGRLWFTTLGGVASVDPQHLYTNTLPPPVHIEQVMADRKTYDPSRPVALPPLVRDLTIDYTALSLVAPEKNLFRYMLEGRDADWEDAGNRRQAFYTDLAPGNYRFRVIASNNSGVWNEQGATLAFSITPTLWQTSWFWALCAIAFAAFLWEMYRLRTRQLARALAIENHQRELELELAHANRLATMGQLTASIAHEVNQPLTASILNAGSALRWLKSDPPDVGEARQALDRIVRDGNRAADVVGRIRSMVKKAPAEREDLVVNTKITNVLAIANSEILKHGIVVRTELAPDLPLVKGDRVQIQQVLLNLILNAAEAMSMLPDGPRELVIRSGRDESGNVLVSVRDTGPGLSPEAMERIFHPFYTSKKEGLGLGLSICQSIIEAHGGKLWASANSPRGAVFQFTLPVG